jgi:hypothetical protein
MSADAKEKDTKKQESQVQEVPELKTSDAIVDQETMEKSEKMAGLKETAKNVEGIAIAKTVAEKEEKKEEKKEAKMLYPAFFVDEEEKSRVEVDVLFDKNTGKLLSISKTGLGVDFKVYEYLGHVMEWFEFTQPTYDDLSTYRQRCSVYNKVAQKLFIDATQLRNFLLVWHLKDWSLKDKNGNKVELKLDEDGSLSKESMETVYKTFPTLLDVVLTVFEKDIMLA